MWCVLDTHSFSQEDRNQMRGVSVAEVPAGKKDEKRLSLILSSSVYGELSALAKERRTTMTEIVRLALGLVKVAVNEANQGNKLIVAKANGEVLKELVLPG
jgi:hypothetical protein